MTPVDASKRHDLTLDGVKLLHAFNQRWFDMICDKCRRRQAIRIDGAHQTTYCTFETTCDGKLMMHADWVREQMYGFGIL